MRPFATKNTMQLLLLFTSMSFFESVIGSQNIKLSDQQQECIYAANGLCLPVGYNNFRKPKEYQDVNVSIRIAQFSEVDEKHGTLDFSAWLTLTWDDDRLILMDENKTLPYYDLQQDWRQKLWLPDMYVVGLEEIKKPGLIRSDEICKELRIFFS